VDSTEKAAWCVCSLGSASSSSSSSGFIQRQHAVRCFVTGSLCKMTRWLGTPWWGRATCPIRRSRLHVASSCACTW
jgi:hypothetical protein